MFFECEMKELSASVTSIVRGQPVCIYLRYLSSKHALHIPHGKLNIGITIRNKPSVIFVIYLRNFKEESALFPPKSTSEMHRRQRSSLKAVRIRDQLGFSFFVTHCHCRKYCMMLNIQDVDVNFTAHLNTFHCTESTLGFGPVTRSYVKIVRCATRSPLAVHFHMMIC